MGKFDDVAEIPAEKVRTAYTQTVQANAWVPFVQALLTALPLPAIAFLIATAILLTADRVTTEAIVWTYAVIAALFVGLTGREYPRRLNVADATLHNMERLTGVDIDRDGRIGPYPVRYNQLGERNTPAKKQQAVKSEWVQFIRDASKDSTVRGLRAAGWTDEIKSARFKEWLFDRVIMADGEPAALAYGKGQWKIAYPVDEVLAAVDALIWTEEATPRR